MPEIFTFVGCPLVGSIGDDTRIRYGELCRVCNREGPSKIEFLEYAFDAWEGEDIVTAHGAYAVTSRLRTILENSDLKGLSFREMATSKSGYFKDLALDNEIEIPEFHELVITGTASAGSGWWEYDGKCEACGRPFWKHTDRVVDALSSVLKDEIGPPRIVKADSWKHEDIFYLDDAGPPVVTKVFVDLIVHSKVKGVVFHPATWAS